MVLRLRSCSNIGGLSPLILYLFFARRLVLESYFVSKPSLGHLLIKNVINKIKLVPVLPNVTFLNPMKRSANFIVFRFLGV